MQEKLIAELGQWFSIIDVVAIVVTYFFTQRVKLVVPENVRPFMAVVVGFVISAGFASAFNGWSKVIFFGLVYGGGAILLYEAGFHSIVTAVSDSIKKRVANIGSAK